VLKFGIGDVHCSLLPLLGKLNKFQRRPSVIFQSCVSSKSNIQNYKFASFIRVCLWNLVTRRKGEHRFRVFEKSVPRRKLRPRRKEIIGEWRKLHNKELHNLHFQQTQSNHNVGYSLRNSTTHNMLYDRHETSSSVRVTYEKFSHSQCVVWHFFIS